MPKKLRPMPLGSVFGKLTIVEELDRLNYPKGNSFIRHFVCLCECGNKTTISLNHLANNNTQSCGCLRLENVLKTCITHGLRRHPLYSVYCGMKSRCYNKNLPAYANYGGRGIKIHKSWLGEEGFLSFYNWNKSLPENLSYKKGLELDRRDNNKGYSPKNCRWVTPKVNSNNRRNNIVINHKGSEYTLKAFYDKYNKNGVTFELFKLRIYKNWNPKKAAYTKSRDSV